jgi:Spy/CpxP family protein refolding chaperone
MKKVFIYLIIVVTLINLTALGTMLYQRRLHSSSPCTPMRESRFEQIKRELALSNTQVERFEQIRHEFHVRVDSINRTLEGINQQLMQEIWQPQPDNARIDTLLNKISRLQMISQQRVIRHFYQFKDVLTPEQWQKFYGIVAERFPGKLRNITPRQRACSEK